MFCLLKINILPSIAVFNSEFNYDLDDDLNFYSKFYSDPDAEPGLEIKSDSQFDSDIRELRRPLLFFFAHKHKNWTFVLWYESRIGDCRLKQINK